MSASGRSNAWNRARQLARALEGLAHVLQGAEAVSATTHDLAANAAIDVDTREDFEAACYRIRDIKDRLAELRARVEDEASVARQSEDRAAREL